MSPIFYLIAAIVGAFAGHQFARAANARDELRRRRELRWGDLRKRYPEFAGRKS